MFHRQYNLLLLVRTKNMYLRNYNTNIGFSVFVCGPDKINPLATIWW